jgi:hypothetical protein
MNEKEKDLISAGQLHLGSTANTYYRLNPLTETSDKQQEAYDNLRSGNNDFFSILFFLIILLAVSGEKSTTKRVIDHDDESIDNERITKKPKNQDTVVGNFLAEVEKFIESETVEKIFFLSQHMKVCI